MPAKKKPAKAAPGWLRYVATAWQSKYKYQLQRLQEHVQGVVDAPDLPFKNRSLGRELAYDSDARRDTQWALAAMAASTAARQAADTSAEETLQDIFVRMLKRSLEFSSSEFETVLTHIIEWPSVEVRFALLPSLLKLLERSSRQEPLSDSVQQKVATMASELRSLDQRQFKTAAKLVQQIEELTSDSVTSRLNPDEGWADELRQWAAELPAKGRGLWEAFFRELAAIVPEGNDTEWRIPIDESTVDLPTEEFAQRQLARVPADSWRSKVAQHIDRLGSQQVAARIKGSLLKVRKSKPGAMVRGTLNRELLRGMLWTITQLNDDEFPTALQHAGTCFYEINSPLGLATVCVLAQLPGRAGTGPLATIAARVKAQSQREFLQATLSIVAERLGIPAEDLFDLSFPDFGFTELGRRVYKFGDVQAELQVVGNREVSVTWAKAGKPIKSIPANVKREFATQLEELKTTATGIREGLAGLAARLESSYLNSTTLTPAAWREQLIDNPVAGLLGRRLIWRIQKGKQESVGRWHADGLKDLNGRKLKVDDKAAISLWHPLSVVADTVLEWRKQLEDAEITQPFKQAHRELYRLTDAERRTKTYSNRFAGHILRQAQFRQLAKARGWKTELVGIWDGGDSKVAERCLPRWKLRAEFWVQGAGHEQQTGFTYIATDQVRFYPFSKERTDENREPVSLADVPPLVFSEIMRDVDLFVSVASVGNNPAWQDGGPGGQFRGYWQDFSFGELSTSAQTRRELLERLLPRLKIAKKCSLAERFLVVRGTLRTYKIHLGSSNILMSPNDEYLCIVPKSSRSTVSSEVFLPFDGDGMLSVILSKALMLADDTAITDPTITRQIGKKR